jgi:uracil-DNA glycosylase
MTSELKSLLMEVMACRLCEEHLPSGPRPVVQANAQAKILIAGQAPGRRVHETGIPFNDPSGDRLRLWMGIDKKTFYNSLKIAMLPIGFCYPGTGRSGDLAPRPECAEAWREKLLAQLPEIKLTLVIGRYAHNYHLGALQKNNLTETVKSWKEFESMGLLPMPHPSPRNNIWLKKNAWFEKEFLPALKSRVSKLI